MDDSSQRLAAAENSLRSVLSSGRGAFVDNKGIRWVMHRDVQHYGACIFLFRIFVQDTNNADFEGYLTKKSKWMGGNVSSCIATPTLWLAQHSSCPIQSSSSCRVEKAILYSERIKNFLRKGIMGSDQRRREQLL